MDTYGRENRAAPHQDVEVRLAAAATVEAEARRALEEAELALEAALERAREAGVPWARIGDLTGMTEGQLKWRWHRQDLAVDEYNRRRREERARSPKSRTGPRPGRGPGVSVAEAARQEGRTRKTIYDWIESGRIRATKNELGQTRVLTRSTGEEYE